MAGLYTKHAVQRGIWTETNHLALGQTETTGKLHHVGHSPDIGDAKLQLSVRYSNTRTLALVSIGDAALFFKNLQACLTKVLS
jgi:hypothetical protein